MSDLTSSYTTSNTTILVLISDPVMRHVLRDALDDAGYLVVTAGDLGAAVDRLHEMRPDLLITAPYISSMTGQIAADYLRTKRHGLPIMIVAGYMEDDRVRDMNAIEDFHVFPANFARGDFLNEVHKILSVLQKP